ncbi:pentapeptide repeat-containing protein [Streptomyces coeruleorubidus]|uniref:pentapeptide repeat-containing protein n=1 Tax=Streptomyces coeruleorubidus TaxID=116188 RepID=UPI00187407CF|nr:pentapeptide repeat-containing protein [Streptomyces bellus]GGU15647.1 hypothetical protein GCM10010244_47800 [Streptomyces bellus]
MILSLPGLAALSALLFTWMQVSQAGRELRIIEQGQITNRYNAAINNLGSSSVDVRLGGIYALERLMRDSARDHPTIVSVLAAFLRQHAPAQATKAAVADVPRPDADIEAVMNVLAERRADRDQGLVLDLSKTDLSQWTPARLHDETGIQLEQAILTGSNVIGTGLTNANLRDAWLDEADLRKASLSGADLRDAHLSGSKLSEAGLDQANLQDAWLDKADLREASLEFADLRGAILEGADLREASMYGAHAAGAFFCSETGCADTTATDLIGADLSGADFESASLIKTSVCGISDTGPETEGIATLVPKPGKWECATLTRANLLRANLSNLRLTRINLSGANLAYANLAGADLSNANLTGANLTGTDLSKANLTGARLTGARHKGARLNGTKGLPEGFR